VGGVLMALYGVFAGFGVENFIGPRFGDPGFRFSGSIGNPAYTAAYAIFMIFYAAYLLASKYKNRLFSGGALVLWGLIILFFAVFLAAATRGAFLGFAAAVVAFALYLGFTNRRLRLWILSGAFVFLLLIVLLIIFRDAPFIKSLPFSRIFDISAHADTFRHRAIMWGIALQAFKERPILGWGPENYLYAFDSRFDTAYFNPPEQFGAWFDRAHSIYFDYLAETGILGLLAYLSIFAAFYWQLFKKTRIDTERERIGADKKSKLAGQNQRESAVVKALLFAAPVAYLVQGMVLFDVWPIYLNVFILIAFGNYKSLSH
jgi:O-antigen ligase